MRNVTIGDMIDRASRNFFALCTRSFIFGVEDSLVSTTGLLAGVATAGVSAGTIFLAGIVLIFVEAFSMAAGSFLSERSAEEYISREGLSMKYFIIGGGVMFLSYFISGFVPLLPYLLLPISVALPVSVSLGLILLFVLGAVSAKLFGVNWVKSGLRMLLIGGVATFLGVFVGAVFK